MRSRIDALVGRLCDVLGYASAGLDETFRTKTISTRNYYTHFSAVPARSIFNTTEMYWASQRLAAMITMLALHELGLDDEVIRNQLLRRDDLSRIIQTPGVPF